MEKLIILADLGRVRALKYRQAGKDPAEQNHLEELPEAAAVFHRPAIHDVVTDQAGRFGRSGPAGRREGMSYGEEHELEADLETQAIQRVAERIAGIVRGEGNPAWRLIAPQPVLRAIQAALPAAEAATLSRAEGADLSGHALADLEPLPGRAVMLRGAASTSRIEDKFPGAFHRHRDSWDPIENPEQAAC